MLSLFDAREKRLLRLEILRLGWGRLATASGSRQTITQLQGHHEATHSDCFSEWAGTSGSNMAYC